MLMLFSDRILLPGNWHIMYAITPVDRICFDMVCNNLAGLPRSQAPADYHAVAKNFKTSDL